MLIELTMAREPQRLSSAGILPTGGENIPPVDGDIHRLRGFKIQLHIFSFFPFFHDKADFAVPGFHHEIGTGIPFAVWICLLGEVIPYGFRDAVEAHALPILCWLEPTAVLELHFFDEVRQGRILRVGKVRREANHCKAGEEC